MRIVERKAVELHDKLAGVSSEFARWLDDGGAGRPLRKHHTQLLRLTDQLGGLVDAMDDELAAARLDGDDVLEVGRNLQLRILEVHRVWDFYRSKFGLRYVEWFREHLSAVDEFAWACLEPATLKDRRELPAAAVKAPPLVFLCGEFSPFLHARGTQFEVEEVADAPDSVPFLQLLTALPVPVIGLPWYQLTHLPDAVLVAHEIGHEVERGFDLEATTVSRLRAVQAELDRNRRGGWFAWLREIFADLYAVLAVGPAYVSALIDLLAADPDDIAAEPAGPQWTTHPPAALRIAITTAALEALGFETQATELRAAWAEAYPAAAGSAVTPFLDEVELVGAALLNAPYPQFGGATLPAVVRFTPAQQTETLRTVDQVSTRMAATTTDIRCLVAAARLAFERSPSTYQATPATGRSPQRLILDRIATLIDDRPRSAPLPPASRSLRSLRDDDRAAGAALAALLTGSGRAGPATPRSTEKGFTDDH